MNVKNTLKISLLNYPGLFPNAFSVYHDWFCVNGNGYEWKNGELVGADNNSLADNKDDAIIKLLNEQLIESWKNNSVKQSILNAYIPGDDIREVVTKFIINHNETVVDEIKEIIDVDNKMTDFEIKPESRFSTSFHFYPLCEYAKICNIPDDIKNDWLLAAKKMIDIMDKNREYFDNNYPDDLDFFEKAKKRIYEIYDYRYTHIEHFGKIYKITGIESYEVGLGSHTWWDDMYICECGNKKLKLTDVDSYRLINLDDYKK